MAYMVSPFNDEEEERQRRLAEAIQPIAPAAQQTPDMSPSELEYLQLLRQGPQVKQRGRLDRVLEAIQAGSVGWLEGPSKGMQVAQQFRQAPQLEAERKFKLNVAAMQPMVEREDYWRKHGLDVSSAEDRARRADAYTKRTEAEIAGSAESRDIQRTAEANRQSQRKIDNEIKQARLDFEKGKKTREAFLFDKFVNDPNQFRAYYDAMYGRGVKSEEEFQTELSQYQRKLDAQESTKRKYRKSAGEIEADAAATARGRASVKEDKAAPKVPDEVDPYNAALFLNNKSTADFIKIDKNATTKKINYRIVTPQEIPQDTETRARYADFLSKVAKLYGQDEFEVEEVK